MRIDQYLWCIRLFKSRNLASTICKKGQVKVNGQKVKPSREVLPLDRIEIRKDQLWRTFEILDIPKSRMGAKLVALYVIEKTDPSVFEHQELQNLSSTFQREEGSGRPTKKDRRDLDELGAEKINEEKEDL
ncbi:MAG: RNA-binding S4 domain-containing protein [Flavobacteriaceae bacterium]|jgi:ribosome-associated heat shock protein Hsp15|nr:RNA-binding S4 domain-containing protein [Flavobacteriaceae bacterium]MDG1912526.1 RNA-binding S4 domain-containing protein [Flavobacteriaceae bacterium]